MPVKAYFSNNKQFNFASDKAKQKRECEADTHSTAIFNIREFLIALLYSSTAVYTGFYYSLYNQGGMILHKRNSSKRKKLNFLMEFYFRFIYNKIKLFIKKNNRKINYKEHLFYFTTDIFFLYSSIQQLSTIYSQNLI